jgi:hypothetical protein
MFQRAGYYGRAAAGVPDAVPDGAATADPAQWVITGLTRTVGGAELNPPLVTLTENTSNSEHRIYWNTSGGTMGPNFRARYYFRAGTRRYVQFINSLGGGVIYAGVSVDTQATPMVIVNSGTAGAATLTSSTLTDLGNGDWLLELIHNQSATYNFCAVHGALTAGAPTFNGPYLGTGFTILLRRVDFATV